MLLALQRSSIMFALKKQKPKIPQQTLVFLLPLQCYLEQPADQDVKNAADEMC